MARLSKPRKRKQTAVVDAPKKPAGKRDLFLLCFTILMIVILAIGYKTMDALSIGMYVLMIATLIGTFVKRRFTVSEKIERYIDTASIGAMGIAFILFIVILYQKFTA